MINPLTALSQKIHKTVTMVEYICRAGIHSSRAQKLNKIDLRKYRGNPEKKQRIRRLAFIQSQIAYQFIVQAHMVVRQPIQSKKRKGTVISGAVKSVDIPELIINRKEKIRLNE